MIPNWVERSKPVNNSQVERLVDRQKHGLKCAVEKASRIRAVYRQASALVKTPSAVTADECPIPQRCSFFLFETDFDKQCGHDMNGSPRFQRNDAILPGR